MFTTGTAPCTPGTPPAPGTSIGARYTVVRTLSHTDRSTVSLLHDRESALPRVLKQAGCGRDPFNCSCGRGYDLAYEFRLLRRLSTLQIRAPRPVEQIWDGRGIGIIVSYVPGKTVEQLSAQGAIAPARAVCLARQLCATLARAHAFGIVHQDVKPANVIVAGQHATLIDWDAAATVRPGGAPLNRRQFTHGYASLEQLLGEVQPSNDVFALGRLLEELVPCPRPLLARVIRRATADRAERYPDTAALGHDLDALARLHRLAHQLGLSAY